MRKLVLIAVLAAITPAAEADFHWATNGAYAGVLTLGSDAGIGKALDGSDTAGGRGYIGRCSLTYSLRVLEGEPVHDFVFTWDWQAGDLAIAQVNGQTVTTRNLAKHPDLRERFFSLKPLSVTLATRIEFLDQSGTPIGLGRKNIIPGLVDQAGVKDPLHVPGSPRWSDFFTADDDDRLAREELDRRHRELFLRADRVQLGDLRVTAVGWPEESLRQIAEEYLRREPPPPPPPPAPSPFELAATESYVGRFRGQGVDLRLLMVSNRWTGSLRFRGKDYSLDAEQKAAGLEGRFGEGDQSWAFSAAAGGDNLTFSTASFSAILQRQRFPRLEGRWQGPHVLLMVEPVVGRVAGRLQLEGHDYAFAAHEAAGDLEGAYAAGGKSVPLRIQNEERGLVLYAGGLTEILSAVPNRSTLRVETQPPQSFALYSNGKPVEGRDSVYEFAGGQDLNLELRVKGYQTTRTNLTLPDYGTLTWRVSLEGRAVVEPPPPPPSPFARAAKESYTGRFRGQGVELRLVAEDGKWTGSLHFQGKGYSVRVEQKAAGLEGRFSEGDQSWPFSVIAGGSSLTFSASDYTAVLQRQSLPKLEGRWQAPRIVLNFESTSGQISGRLKLDGQEYPFAVQERAGDLEGAYAAGDKSVPLQIANEERGLVLITGDLTAVLKPAPNRSTLRVQTQPPAPFTLSNEGQVVEGRDGAYEFAGGQALKLELRAKGYRVASTNHILPNYGELTWTVALEPRLYPSLETRRWTNSLGMVFVPVPGTEVVFCLWETRVQDYTAFDKTKPGSDPSWRRVEFRGVRVSDGPDHPVTMVSRQDAQQFCRWLTETEQAADLISPQQRYRLPTDSEWNQAIGLRRQGNDLSRALDIGDLYPWGFWWPPSAGAANLADDTARSQFGQLSTIPGYDDGYAATSPVEAFKPNRYGLYDLGGNVCQWCEDWYDSEQQLHLVRGGSWRSFRPELLLSSHRTGVPDGRENNVGFRCVLVVSPGVH
jgi:hypothetical protein